MTIFLTFCANHDMITMYKYVILGSMAKNYKKNGFTGIEVHWT